MKEFLMMSAAATLVLIAACVWAEDQKQADGSGQSDLKLFVKGTTWQFINGQEFPRADGSFTLGTDDDKPVGILKYDFSNGGAYVAANTKVIIPDTAGELRVSAKASRKLKIAVRLIDDTNQCHQYVKSIDPKGSWETIGVALQTKSPEYWGGGNDGQVHFPVKIISLCVQKPGQGDATGTVEFADAVMLAK